MEGSGQLRLDVAVCVGLGSVLEQVPCPECCAEVPQHQRCCCVSCAHPEQLLPLS